MTTSLAINKELCTSCSLCAQACPSLLFQFQDRQTRVSDHAQKECIRCGQRMHFPTKLSIPEDHALHASFTFGYPRFKYKKSIARPFKSTQFVQ